MLLLEQNTIKKEQVHEFLKLKLNARKDRKYKIEAIRDSAIYNKVVECQLPELYHLVFSKYYLDDKSTWDPVFAVFHLQKMISIFYKNHSKKPTATSPHLNSALPMDRLMVKLIGKQKRGGSRPT